MTVSDGKRDSSAFGLKFWVYLELLLTGLRKVKQLVLAVLKVLLVVGNVYLS